MQKYQQASRYTREVDAASSESEESARSVLFGMISEYECIDVSDDELFQPSRPPEPHDDPSEVSENDIEVASIFGMQGSSFGGNDNQEMPPVLPNGHNENPVGQQVGRESSHLHDHNYEQRTGSEVQDLLPPDIADREMEEMPNIQEWQNNASNLPDCSVCSDTLSCRKIFMCLEGHCMCDECKMILKACSCQKKWSRVFIKTHLTPSLFQCTNRIYGCPEMKPLNAMKSHVKVCSYRPIICNIKGYRQCTDKAIAIKEYLHHLKHFHLIERSTETEEDRTVFNFNINPKMRKMQLNYMEYGGKILLNHALIHSNMLYVWTTVLDHDTTLEDLNLCIGFGRVDCYEHKNLWIIRLKPPNVKIENIIKSSSCATMPTSQMKYFTEMINGIPTISMKIWIIDKVEASSSDSVLASFGSTFRRPSV